MYELLKQLDIIQRAEGLSDRQFAAKLGLSNGLWSGVRSGERTMGRKTLRAIERLYPGLSLAINSYWVEYLRTGQAEVPAV